MGKVTSSYNEKSRWYTDTVHKYPLTNIKIKEYDYSSPLIIECEHKLFHVSCRSNFVDSQHDLKYEGIFLSHLKFYLVNYLIWKIAQ